MRRLIKILIFFVICGIASVSAGIYFVLDWSKQEFQNDAAVTLHYARGTTLNDLSWQLESHKLIDSGLLFTVFTKMQRNYHKFQAGTYQFKGVTTPRQIAEKIMAGDTFSPIILKFTIPEGFTQKKILKRLQRLGLGNAEKLRKITDSPAFLKKHRIPGTTAEGFLYPATYHFRKNPSAREVLNHLAETFWKKLPEDYIDQVEQKGLSLLDAVTFASLIELETKFEDEKPKISEVIWRRLKMGSPLGIDAAVIYGIKDYKGDIKWKHLKDASNPYNLRIHKGLPPTPISNPDIKSMLAVLAPTNKGYNYYVVNASSKEGRHHFSRTQEEHNRYVRKLVRSGHGR